MCGRFVVATPGAVLTRLLGLREEVALTPRYNIAPTQPVLAVRTRDGGAEREATRFQWGLVPSWAKDPAIGARMINARVETAATKPSFRSAWRKRRCVIPATGFYEWRAGSKPKQPFFIYPAEAPAFLFAGLWERWTGPDGTDLETCAILTCAANAPLEPIHHRMPVMVPEDSLQAWLLDEQAPDLPPCPPDAVAFHEISTLVNRTRNDSPACIQPLAGAGQQTLLDPGEG